MTSLLQVPSGNPDLERALAYHRSMRDEYISALQHRGLVFADEDQSRQSIDMLRSMLISHGVCSRNSGASLSYGWLSRACVECTGNAGSETFSTTLECHRDCYFCFNHNLSDYDKFVNEGCPWEDELARCYGTWGGDIAAIGLTGGEPLLNLADSLAFITQARNRFPSAHIRMYTSGDLLTRDSARKLSEAGLDEIRFSIKQEDDALLRATVLGNLAMARDHIDDVMVEMPVIPGTDRQMRTWFKEFDSIGIDGVNLLEFCFPFHGWGEFGKRGFTLKNPPFDVMYDYGYSGGLAVEGSELLALQMMLFGIEEHVGFGMHYCSLDNKHRSEMRQKNEPGKGIHPAITFDEGDFFLKMAKVYGEDRLPALDILSRFGCGDFIEDEDEKSLAFPLSELQHLNGSPLTPVVSFNVLERDDRSHYLREVHLAPAI